MTQGVSVHEFAKLANCSHATVSRGIASGRLKLMPEGGIDPKQARTNWRAHAKKPAANDSAKTDTSAEAEPEINLDGTIKKRSGRPLKRPDDAQPSTATEYARIALDKERSLAALRRMEYEQRAGSLVVLEAVRHAFFNSHRGLRDAWLNWPSRVAPRLAAELGVEPDDALRVLTKLVHEHMHALGDPDGLDI